MDHPAVNARPFATLVRRTSVVVGGLLVLVLVLAPSGLVYSADEDEFEHVHGWPWTYLTRPHLGPATGIQKDGDWSAYWCWDSGEFNAVALIADIVACGGVLVLGIYAAQRLRIGRIFSRQFSLRTLLCIVALFAVFCSCALCFKRRVDVHCQTMRNLDHASGVDYERIGPDWLWDAIVSRLPAWVWERCGKDFAWHYFGKPVAADLVDTDLQCLSELPDLRGLRIRQGDRTCARVAQLQPLSKLERLELEVGVDGEEILWASPRLKVLKVCGVRSRAELPDIRVLRHLKAVDVSQMHHTGDAMEYLGSVPGLIILDQPED